MSDENRAGKWLDIPGGGRAFSPHPLPPHPPIEITSELQALLSEADRSLGRLDGATEILPNPDLFVSMFVRQEAVLSSQIEGTQSSLSDVLEFEAGILGERVDDSQEVLNYVSAMNLGITELDRLPLSLRLIRLIHGELMSGARGELAAPGDFRRLQNWIAPSGIPIERASFVPPPVPEMTVALNQLEEFLHEQDGLPALVHCAITHAQFETIHPFLDGNGRVGRLLITFQLVERGVLQKPLLYLSHFFKQYRAEYYDRLMAVRMTGDWEGWIAFFLRGVIEVSREAARLARGILQLREKHLRLVGRERSPLAYPLLEHLFQRPIVSVRTAEEHLGCTYAQANNLIARFEQLGILDELTGQRRNRVWRYSPYVRMFPSDTVVEDDASGRQETAN
ncbi:MAG: Filamentation induced by cAMP protein Fic [Thermoleophilia bacterium]|nr:Filamentation induced by cAMP protein Fic [Thermoleophilia bacterium]